MTRLRPSFTPPNSNAPGLFAYGQTFDVEVSGVSGDGVWWFQAATGDVTDVDAFLYDSSESVLASGTLAAGSITPNDWHLVTFDTPAALAIGTGYRYAAEAAGQGAFDAGDQGYPIASPDEALTATAGAFASGGGFPSSDWTGQHGIDFEYSVSSETAEGVAAFDLSLAVASSGSRPSEGVASFSLKLNLAAIGQDTAPAVAAGSYAALLDILRINTEEFTEALRLETDEPVECPNDGEPLRAAPDGGVYCPYDGWRP